MVLLVKECLKGCDVMTTDFLHLFLLVSPVKAGKN